MEMLTLSKKGVIREDMVAKKGGENNYVDYLGFNQFIMHIHYIFYSLSGIHGVSTGRISSPRPVRLTGTRQTIPMGRICPPSPLHDG